MNQLLEKIKLLKPNSKRQTTPLPTQAPTSSTLKKPSKLNIQLSKKINFYLVIMIFIYIIIEISFNYLLVNQMAFSATALDIHHIEQVGKVVSGIGMALLMAKSLLNHAYLEFKFFMKVFVAFLGIGICLSIFLQTTIVKQVVKHATPVDQQRALLVSMANTTLVPFYDDEAKENHITLGNRLMLPIYQTFNSDSKAQPIAKKYQRLEHFYSTSNACSAIAKKSYANHYPINNVLDKVFFGYTHLIAHDSYEGLHKTAITNYFTCVFDDKILADMYADNLQPLKDKVAEFYQEYAKKSEKYNENLKKYPNRKEMIDERWQSGIKDVLEFDATLPPNLPFEVFVKHPDVKTYMGKNQTFKLPYPYTDNMSQELQNSLPDFILANYLIAKQNGIAEDAPKLDDPKKNDPKDWFKDQPLTPGKQAYKAVVMPMIAFGFSVVFLVLNVVSVLSLIISDKSKKVSTWFQRIATAIFFIIPFALPTASLSIPPNDSVLKTVIIQFLYFYQHIIWMIQQGIVGLF